MDPYGREAGGRASEEDGQNIYWVIKKKVYLNKKKKITERYREYTVYREENPHPDKPEQLLLSMLLIRF